MTNEYFLTKSARRKIFNPAKKIFLPAAKKFKLPLLLTILHIPLGLVLYRLGALGAIHPLIVLLLGLYLAFRKSVKIERVAFVAAYLIGAEVLWRMSGAAAAVGWEFGKYGAAVLMIVALAQRGHWKIPTMPLLYLIFLLPSCLLTLTGSEFENAREKLSFNMSGPFLLFVACWFFSHVRINQFQLKKLLLMIAVPLVSVAVATLFYAVTVPDIQFGNESNFATSGGFGPNQVSSMLGLGVFVCLACYLLFKNNYRDTIYLVVLMILFAAQSVLTFSRGGIYNAVGAVVIVLFFQMRNFNSGVKKLIPVLGITLVFLILIFPFLNDFTGGNLQERFESTDSTNRIEIIESDFQLFMENPILGTGVGESKRERKEFLDFQATSHTEFSRIISEHGVFGIFSLIALGLATIYNLRRQKTTLGKALVGGVVIWSSLFMMNAGMRLAAPAFMWSLSFLILAAPVMKRRKILRNKKAKDLRQMES